MNQPFNNLTDAQAERLALLLEELGEAQQSIGKILRHGYESHNPDGDVRVTNRELLEIELGDVVQAMQLLSDEEDLSMSRMMERTVKRWSSVYKYFHHQPKSKRES